MKDQKNKEKIQALKKTEIFRDLSDEDLEDLSGHMTNRMYPAGVTILREGSRGSAMFIIRSGEVEIKKRKPELGIDLTIAKLTAGDIFGEYGAPHRGGTLSDCRCDHFYGIAGPQEKRSRYTHAQAPEYIDADQYNGKPASGIDENPAF